MEGNVLLIIAAHPDDPEFGCGATVAKYIKEGATAYYVICTNGHRGSRANKFDAVELVETRHSEQENAANIIGVTETFFLDHDDGNLTANLEVKEQIVRIIRKLKPDIILTHDPSWFYQVSDGSARINHNDHRQTGIATLDAVYPLSRDLASFPEHAKAGLTPHHIPEVLLFSVQTPDYFVDVSSSWETKVKAVLAHKSQVDDPKQTEKRVEERMKELGKQAGHDYAEGFIRLLFK